MEPVGRAEELVNRIRSALRGRAGAEPPRAASPARAPAVPVDGKERIDLFRRKFEELGGVFLAGPSEDRVIHALAEELRIEGVAALICEDGDPAARSVTVSLVPFGPFLLAGHGEILQAVPPPSAGVQSAEFAIAETGTIVQTSREGKSLLPGLATDIHVALLTPGRFLGAMEECLESLAADPPRNVSFITGPSRTADIELTLTIGVHGPRKVITVLLP